MHVCVYMHLLVCVCRPGAGAESDWDPLHPVWCILWVPLTFTPALCVCVSVCCILVYEIYMHAYRAWGKRERKEKGRDRWVGRERNDRRWAHEIWDEITYCFFCLAWATVGCQGVVEQRTKKRKNTPTQMQRARACFLSAFHSIILSIAQHRFKHRSYRDGLPYTRTLYLSTAPPFKKKETRILFLIINSLYDQFHLLWRLLKKVKNFSCLCRNVSTKIWIGGSRLSVLNLYQGVSSTFF